MKKLLYLATLSMVVTLFMASAALGQDEPREPGNTVIGLGDTVFTEAGESFLVEDSFASADGFQTIVNSEGEEIVVVDSRVVDGNLIVTPAAEDPGTGSDQYQDEPEPPVAPEDPMAGEPLPDTGGPALLLPAAGLLLATGLIGLKVVRRRS